MALELSQSRLGGRRKGGLALISKSTVDGRSVKSRPVGVRFHRAFTLVELLVVIAIIGVLVGLLLPAVQAAREAARRTQCSNNLKQIGLAFHGYHAAFQKFPDGWREESVNPLSDRTSHAWGLLILPYMEQEPLYSRFDLDKKITDGIIGGDEDNIDLIGRPLAIYRCPSDDGPAAEEWQRQGKFFPNIPALAISNYVGSGTTCTPCLFGQYERGQSSAFGCPNGPTGILFRNSGTKIAEVVDGTSNTFLIGERAYAWRNGTPSAAYWAGPPGAVSNLLACFAATMTASSRTMLGALQDREVMINGHAFGFNSEHPGGVQVTMADGSVSFLNEDIEQETAIQMVEVADGTVLGVL